MDQRKEGRTYEVLAKKAGIGKSNMANLLAVYKARTQKSGWLTV
ncbi:hypothetical protein [Bhargavaea ginsengi]|nr:hypothetical protein [Bhargavaea ginsengi]